MKKTKELENRIVWLEDIHESYTISQEVVCGCGSRMFYAITNLVLTNKGPFGTNSIHKCVKCGRTYDNHGNIVEEHKKPKTKRK